MAHGFSDETLGRANRCDRRVSLNQPAQQRRRKRATRAVGGAGLDALAGKAMQLTAGQAQQVGWWLGIASGDNDMQMRVTACQVCGSCFRLG